MGCGYSMPQSVRDEILEIQHQTKSEESAHSVREEILEIQHQTKSEECVNKYNKKTINKLNKIPTTQR